MALDSMEYCGNHKSHDHEESFIFHISFLSFHILSWNDTMIREGESDKYRLNVGL
jgi:hypothetical protein